MAHGPDPGWYDDPADAANLRYWDGEAWTGQVRAKHGAPTLSAPSPVAPTSPPPPNYLAQSILATLLCCLPLGIVAIVKASQVNSLWQSGQHQAARAASADTRRWAWIAFGVGIGIYVVVITATLLIYFSGGFDTARDVIVCSVDTVELEDAEDGYFADHGRYASEETLVSAGFLGGPSELHDIVLHFEGESYRVVVADSRCGSVGDVVDPG